MSRLIYQDKYGEARVSSIPRRIADRAEFWWNRAQRPDELVLFDSKIRTGREDFFNEIIRNHPVPVDMNTLKALKRSTSLGLDLYLWLNYRTFALRAPLRLSWKQLYQPVRMRTPGQRQATSDTVLILPKQGVYAS